MAYKVYFVGAGPAGADLITVRGLEVLRQADVVIYDYLVDKGLLQETKERAELVCCDTLGKRRHDNGFSHAQKRIDALIVRKAKEGKRVVRLKNGDPMIFSRISQELEALARNKIEFEIVPGVTAASAAAAYAGVPLTDRRSASSVVFVTGHLAENKENTSLDYRGIAGCGTIVLYMAMENIAEIVKGLREAGKPEDTPIIVVSCAGQISQKIARATLKDIGEVIRRQHIAAPAIFIIGKVADLEKKFNWSKRNKRILFTGLSKKRFFIKGSYFHLPLIRILPIADYGEFDGCLKDILRFDWIVFTSRYGVEFFFRRLGSLGFDARLLNGIKIAAIGESTSRRLSDFGIRADLQPQEESSQGLLEEFRGQDIQNKEIFIPRSDISDKGLVKGLKDLKANVTAGIAYRNVQPGNLPDFDVHSFDEIVFTSPSTVRNFRKRYGRVPREIKARYIGEVTKDEARRQGFKV